ncbi:MAG TPA: glycosyltransferase family 4 protein [Flavobacterium sp.]|uniref:glycosyltransferase family 4 protein n=1 Tax=Flavobacterium sp. TaxID=239 RepID=UPI002B4B573F|nr:glycosyltransferase family 4 protein [Flavobacterium sp.]HLO74374.1 glycosyltransferase family 4 protein [Flavobacterium sp.]
MKSILFVHQSAELYGSDKTLLLLLKHINKQKFCPIVVLPNDGPLKKELEKENIEVFITPVIKLHRKMFTPTNLLLLLNHFRQGFSTLNKLHKKYRFEIIYSNTLAVLIGFLFARIKGIKHIWHVHEIIESPKLVSKIFSFLISRRSNFFTIYNSKATAIFWESFFGERKNYIIVSNGLEIQSNNITTNEIELIRKKMFEVEDEIVIGLVGRINRWKGQFMLLEAFNDLIKKHSNLKLIFVGSTTDNQQHIINELNSKIQKYQIEKNVKIIPFQSNINSIWKAIDIAVVPSIEPEPFGLVAVEAMLASKPVVASNHGGLTEIIDHQQTGFLIEPNNIQELINAIEKLINDKKLRLDMGQKGYKRAAEEFSIQKHVSKIEKVLAD